MPRVLKAVEILGMEQVTIIVSHTSCTFLNESVTFFGRLTFSFND